MKFSTIVVLALAIVNFSVPDDVKASFDATFRGQNKSAIVAQLMREAVAREDQRRAGKRAVERIRKRHRSAPLRSNSALRKARNTGRP